MARDKGTGAAPPRPRRRPLDAADRAPIQDRPGAQPTQPLPQSKPVPAMQRRGYNEGVQELNVRVQAITDAHERAFGVRPTPGVVFDLVRAPISPDRYEDLLALPRTKRSARALGIFRSENGILQKTDPLSGMVQDESLQVPRTPDVVLAEWEQASKDGRGDSYFRKHQVELEAIFYNPKEHPSLEDIEQEAMLAGPPDKAAKVITVGAEGFGRLLAGLVTGPTVIAVEEAKALKKEVTGDFRGQHLYEANKQLASAILGGLKADAVAVKDRDTGYLAENWGFIALDFLGLGGFVASGPARAGRAAAARKAGASRAEAAKELLRRPAGETFEIGLPGATERVLLSENQAVKYVQRYVLQKRQERYKLRQDPDGEPIPASLLPSLTPQLARRYLSLEGKLGKEAKARRDFERVLANVLARDLEAVAGWSRGHSAVRSKLPNKLGGGLTRGEQMAIFLRSIDDPNPAGTLRAFHERMISLGVGSRKAHEQKIRDIALAEKTLFDPSKQSRRFQDALRITEDTVATMEALRIQRLGLSPVTAESRVARLGAIIRGEEETGRATATSFYLPVQATSRKAARYAFGGARSGPFGIPLFKQSRHVPELTHEFTGELIRAGTYRIDATGLVGEAYGRTVRAVSILDDYQRLVNLSHATKRSEFDVPIRTVDGIPQELRQYLNDLDEGVITPGEMDVLSRTDASNMLRFLFPEDRDASRIDGVRWVDRRQMIDDSARVPAVPGLGRKTLQGLNEPLRAATLYMRPAYALNLLSNAGMLVLQQGVFEAPETFARAVHSNRLLGDKVTRSLDALASGSRSRSYVADVDSMVNAPGRAAAEFWHVVADQMFRRAALIYEFNRKGIRTREQFEAALFGDDAKLKADAFEASRRANKAMVQFDNLTWYERHYLRHLIFVYPWIRGASVWSLRTLIEHPVKSDVIAQLGREHEDEKDAVLGKGPEWFEKRGYFPTSWEGDRPKVVTGSQLAAFSTLRDTLGIGTGQVTGGRFTALSTAFGPAVEALLHGVTGKDEFGNDYEGSPWVGALQDQILGLPQGTAWTRAHKERPALKPFDITRRQSAVTRQNSALEQDILGPGTMGGWGMLVTGGLTEREYNKLAAEARYWADQPLEKRHAHEMKLIQGALQAQGRLLKRSIPAVVRDAVELAGKRELAYKEEAADLGRDLTYKERIVLDLDTLEVPAAQRKELREQLRKLKNRDDLEDFKAKLLDEYGEARALKDWDRDVRIVASFRKDILERKLKSLRGEGLIASARVDADQETLFEYGRKYLAYDKQAREQYRAARLTPSPDRSIAFAELRAWEEQQDRPVTVNGKTLPSLVRLAWAHLAPEQKQDVLAQNAGKYAWSTISSFEKELLGKRPPAKLAQGWLRLAQVVAEYRAAQPPGQRRLPPGYENQLARYVDKHFAPGFYQDWLFAREPLARRLQVLKVPVSSPKWPQLLNVAARYADYLKSDGYSKTGVKDAWRDYVASTLRPWVESDPVFAGELEPFGPDLLGKMLD
jgi:hypothetical protein